MECLTSNSVFYRSEKIVDFHVRSSIVIIECPSTPSRSAVPQNASRSFYFARKYNLNEAFGEEIGRRANRAGEPERAGSPARGRD